MTRTPVRFEAAVQVLVAAVLVCVLPMHAAQAGAPASRIALVIGNATYPGGPMRTPVNDATDVAATLKQLGYEVNLLEDADLQSMRSVLQAYSRRLGDGAAGIFYFSGRGLQVAGEQYLVPRGVSLAAETDAQARALPLGAVLQALRDARNRYNIIIVDASRSNPFAASGRQAAGGRTLMDAPAGTFIAYATAPGEAVLEGTGRNSLYTRQLLRQLGTRGLDVETLFRKVRGDVVRETAGRQVPWETSSLNDGSFLLAPP